VNNTLDRLMIGDALAKLSAVHLAVVGRAYYLGWTMAHIADDLQIAEGTVKSRLHCAVRTLRLTLQEMGVTRISQFGCVGALVCSTDTHPDR
jgi:RNA polymerase sigma-70 factor (ECF subfamily)